MNPFCMVMRKGSRREKVLGFASPFMNKLFGEKIVFLHRETVIFRKGENVNGIKSNGYHWSNYLMLNPLGVVLSSGAIKINRPS